MSPLQFFDSSACEPDPIREHPRAMMGVEYYSRNNKPNSIQHPPSPQPSSRTVAKRSSLSSLDSTTSSLSQIQCFIYDNVRAQAPKIRAPTKLPSSFVPSYYDVICGKGKACFNNIGNRRFRILVELHVPRYQAAQTKMEKSAIVNSIVQIIRTQANAGFIKTTSCSSGNNNDNKKDNDEQNTPVTTEATGWIEVGDVVAREKVGQTLRDLMSYTDPKRKAQRMIRQARRKAKKQMRMKQQQQLKKVQPQQEPVKKPKQLVDNNDDKTSKKESSKCQTKKKQDCDNKVNTNDKTKLTTRASSKSQAPKKRSSNSTTQQQQKKKRRHQETQSETKTTTTSTTTTTATTKRRGKQLRKVVSFERLDSVAVNNTHIDFDESLSSDDSSSGAIIPLGKQEQQHLFHSDRVIVEQMETIPWGPPPPCSKEWLFSDDAQFLEYDDSLFPMPELRAV